MIAATKDFVSKSEHRPFHKYIKLNFSSDGNEVTAIAVYGYRLSVEHAMISDCDEDFTVYVKPGIKLPSKNYATFTLENNEVIIRCDGFVFGYEQPAPTEFDWEKAVPPGEPVFEIGFNGNYLLSALQAAKVSCGNTFKHPVILEFRAPELPILLRTNKEDLKMVLPVRINKRKEST